MPCSPKDAKSMATGAMSDDDNDTDVKPTPPIVFTFNTTPSVPSKKNLVMSTTSVKFNGKLSINFFFFRCCSFYSIQFDSIR